MFRALDPERSGIVTGEKARLTFEKSGLPPNILGEIWQLADSANMGFLSQFGFCFAMRLIGHTQAGQYPSAQLAETPGPLPKFSNLISPGQLAPQATSNSLLQTQPSSYVSQPQQAPQQDLISPVSSADYDRFSQMFIKTTGSRLTPLDGNSAKDILTKAKLPTHTLGQIWSLVDINNKGQLDLPAFVMAMHLIHGLLSGSLKQLPPFLPDHLWKSVCIPEQSVSQSAPAPFARQDTASQEWIVTALQKEQFDSIFDSIDTAKEGSLGPDQVATFLKTSRLDQLDLAAIWDLLDIESTGIFTKLEFSIALFLVNRRRAGMPLPNVVPRTLISSLQTSNDAATATSAAAASNFAAPVQSQPPQIPSEPVKIEQKTSAIDDLADVFGSLAVQPGVTPKPSSQVATRAPLQNRTSSSDLTYLRETPTKPRGQLTSSFAPTSEFGKSLLALEPTVISPSLLVGDSKEYESGVSSHVPQPPTPAATQQVTSPSATLAPTNVRTNTVDYEALRNIPAPPKSRSSVILPSPGAGNTQGYFPPQELPRTFSKQENSDLLADSEIAGKLSDANTDIANISNQVKSLATQTSNLHDKKTRAEQELTRILKLKEEIDAKLKLLRTSYANEVKQVEQVESTLATAKEETEALRSEASIAEAKLNHLSGELHEKQLAVEEHQKINSTLREKLGNVNAEIAELSKQFESKSNEVVRLENEANVRKSQHQVVLVKIDDLKQSLTDLDTKNAHLLQEIEKAHRDEAYAIAQAKELQDSVAASEKKNAVLGAAAGEAKKKASHIPTSVVSLAGAAAVGVAGVLATSTLDHSNEKLNLLPESTSATTEEPPLAKTPAHFETSHVPGAYVEAAEPLPKSSAEEPLQESGYEDATESFLDKEDYVLNPANNSEEPTVTAPPPPVASLVDEVVEHPAPDMTGLDDLEEVRGDAVQYEAPTEYEQEEIDNVNDKFPEMTNDFDGSLVHASTKSYKPTEGGDTVETPVTSPNVSEYQFQSANVVGGLVGMPGVLVGVQRTDSLTSSIQNNPSMSVRDDNIDEVSDRDALDEVTLPQEHHVKAGTEVDRSSLGVGLFEMVTSDDAKEHVLESLDQPLHPLSQSFKFSDGSVPSANDEEFPPIRELEVDESSSDDEQSVSDKFDDATAEISQFKSKSQEFGGEFDDLKPATVETCDKEGSDDFFGDEFDDLKVAEDDIEDDIDPVDISINDQFTSPPMGNPENASSSNDNSNDEWEQLFAGFGNAAQAPVAGTAGSPLINVNHDLAIEELKGMGFPEHDVRTALETENWNVEAATNYLLDHA